MIQLVMPIYWVKRFKTKKDQTVLTGMSWYRNAHYTDQNRWKQEFSELVSDQLEGVDVRLNCYRLYIQLFYKNKVCDGSNIIPVIEKVVLDALQELEIIPQDSVLYHLGTVWEVAGQDRDNPRCEILIKPEE